eukprot:70726-Pleurochrysis_carterae.AAC.4
MRREIHDWTPAGLPVVVPSTDGMRAAQSGRQLVAICAVSITYKTSANERYCSEMGGRKNQRYLERHKSSLCRGTHRLS